MLLSLTLPQKLVFVTSNIWEVPQNILFWPRVSSLVPSMTFFPQSVFVLSGVFDMLLRGLISLHFASHPAPGTLAHPPSGSTCIGGATSNCSDTQRCRDRTRTNSLSLQTLTEGSLHHHTTLPPQPKNCTVHLSLVSKLCLEQGH